MAALTLLVGCKPEPSARPVGAPVAIAVPLGLPPVPYPADNPPTADAIALGRRLFYDTRLSQDNSLSCASCHGKEFAFADRRPRSLGVGGSLGLRNAPTLLNAAYMPTLFWDGRAQSLEAQSAVPMADPREMAQTHQASVAKLAADPAYAALFQRTFGTPDVTLARVENALASFERTLLSGDSPFDEYEYGGRKDALTPAQIRGLALFTDPARGDCAACHTIGAHSALFTDGLFHNTGEGVAGDGRFSDDGRFSLTRIEADSGSFKTPSLRNVALTAPYMHDGQLKTLADVVEFYAGGGNSSPFLDSRIHPVPLSSQDKRDLVEFMKSLTGKMPDNVGPPPKDASQ